MIKFKLKNVKPKVVTVLKMDSPEMLSYFVDVFLRAAMDDCNC